MKLNLSSSDIDALSRIVAAEAGNQSEAGQLGVMFTVFNRMASNKFPSSVTGVIQQRGQFEPMSGKSSAFELPDNPAIRAKVEAWLPQIMNGQLTDPTNGATFFQNTAITNQRGTNFAGSAPTATIEDHSFYNQYRNNDPVKVANYSVTVDGYDKPTATISQPSQHQLAQQQPLIQQPQLGQQPEQLAGFMYPQQQEMSGTAAGFMRGADILAGRAPGSGMASLAPPAPIPVGFGGASPPQQFAMLNQPVLNTEPVLNTATDVPQSFDHSQAAAITNAPTYGSKFGLKPVHDGVNLSGINPNVSAAASAAANRLGWDIPVTSGYRSQAKQDAIRGRGDPNRITVAKRSQHTEGDALDIPIRDMSPEQISQLVDTLAGEGFTAFGYYGKKGHLHADMRGAVPSSFNPESGWGGWTPLPSYVMSPLVKRGWSAGAASSSLKRGF